ncbi:MAG: TetR/AcrR family transcriptional regulator [Proteobacteria bacterium]|nr:TetR/AcrR family transcriptional regulator [Pseudomonadota bacterium]
MDQRARQLPAEERRALTVSTVLELAAERDPQEITTAAIAERMQLTQGALFRHFPSKEHIWSAAVEWLGGELLNRTQKAAAGAPTSIEAMEAMFLAHIKLVSQFPGIPRLLFGELQRADDTLAKLAARSIIKRYRERLLTLIKQGKHSGEIDVLVDAPAAATMYVGMVQGLVAQALIAGNVKGLRGEAPGAFELFRRAIVCRTGANRTGAKA